MKVRTKIISLLALLFAMMGVLEIVIEQRVLMPSFAELERDDARTSMKRIDYALNVTLDNLQLRTADWGDWGELYRFVQAPSAAFVDAYITTASLKQLQVNTVMIVDLKGNILAAGARDLDSGAPLNLDFAAMRTLPENFPWRRDPAVGTAAKGMVKTNQGVMMVAAAPVLDGSAGGRSLGMVIMGRLLSQQQVQMIGAVAQANLSMMSDRFTGGTDRLVETDAVTQVFRPYCDIYGKPLLSLRVEVPRKITERGRGAVTYASACLVVAAIAALMLLVIVLNRIVLAPLARVTRHALTIGEGADLTARLDLPGHDEVAVLAREFDRMVERVAESRRQFMDQSFQAGFAELAKGVLHNLGNAMTPLGVRVSKLGERLRAAPTADVELAVAELAREPAGSERYADLQEFLRLGCRELRAAVKDAQADVMVIQNQTVIVQTALTELMRSTRNEHVVESVRLPDLVSQTLEIVPDACRQRLIVEADESLRRVGVVQVARTVLRLVLQNLIINAADAVRDAGRDKGVLRVAAEIVRDADREQLHLRCEDNGVGIEKGNLERVFDKGFSTKSRDTNYGIGLHWCANAVAALGGRIWAASEGPGRGASMHLMVPLTIRPARPNP
jgi:sensor domain CHASE-containing protein/anti-sigma regulatory factor (Ser/Thr protein kinase)